MCFGCGGVAVAIVARMWVAGGQIAVVGCRISISVTGGVAGGRVREVECGRGRIAVFGTVFWFTVDGNPPPERTAKEGG